MSSVLFSVALWCECPDSIWDFSAEFNANIAYTDLCDNLLDIYSSIKSKDLYLKNPSLKYLHRFLTYTFSGRKNASNILNKTELYSLWSMATKQKIHLDFWVATQLSGTITYHRPLILGHIFTSLVVNLKLLHPDYTDLTPSMNQPPGPTYFGRYGVVSQGEGSFFPYSYRSCYTTLWACVQKEGCQPGSNFSATCPTNSDTTGCRRGTCRGTSRPFGGGLSDQN